MNRASKSNELLDLPPHPERRVEDKRWYRRVWEFSMAPVVDDYRGLSLTRIIAVFLMVLIGHEVFVHEQGLTWIDFWIALAAIATAFGKSVFTFLLTRVSLRSESRDITQKIDATIRQRRESGAEWQAEPTE